MPTSAATQRLASLEGYLKQDPQNPSLLAETVMAAVEAGHVSRAAELLDGASSLGSDAQVCHARGVVALAEHRFEEAAAIFEELLLRGMAEAAIRFNLAYARFRSGEVARALDIFKELLGNEAAPGETLAYVVRCHHHLGDPQTAAEAWDLAPPRFKTARNAGVASLAFLDASRLGEAVQLAELALSQGDAPVEAMVTRATLLLGDGDVPGASRLLDAAMAIASGDGRVWSAIGAAALLTGEFTRARDAFERASRLLPQHVGTWLSLAWCQILGKDLDGARASLERAMAIDRNVAETHGGLAVVDALQGRVDDARQGIERANRLDRSGLSARYAETILGGRASDREAIEALARRLLRGRPGPDGAALLERALLGLRTAGRR